MADDGENNMELTLAELRTANVERCRRWHPKWPNDDWTGADWSNAMAGEMGEAANVVKKLRRAETGTVGAGDPTRERLVAMLGDELADTIIYADLLAAYYGVDLGAAIAKKFNAVSVREGFPERLPVGYEQCPAIFDHHGRGQCQRRAGHEGDEYGAGHSLQPSAANT